MNLTQEEFLRLLEEWANAFASAVLAMESSSDEYREAMEKAAEAKQALIKAVFP
jgi:dihydrodipicolinate synthase/N-acetylneuraminate lyase